MPNEDGYEVVIRTQDGLEKEHADLLRKELIADGYHDHAVQIRESTEEIAPVQYMDRTWCTECERWVGDGVEHSESCSLEGGEETPRTLDEYSEDDLVAALEAIEEVDHVWMGWWHDHEDFRVHVWMDDDVESFAPLGPAARTFDLRIWTVSWIMDTTFLLVPAAGFQHVYEGAADK